MQSGHLCGRKLAAEDRIPSRNLSTAPQRITGKRPPARCVHRRDPVQPARVQAAQRRLLSVHGRMAIAAKNRRNPKELALMALSPSGRSPNSTTSGVSAAPQDTIPDADYKDEIRKRAVNFRVGSNPEVSDYHENVSCWGQSRSRFRATGGPFIAMNEHLPSLATLHCVRRFDGW